MDHIHNRCIGKVKLIRECLCMENINQNEKTLNTFDLEFRESAVEWNGDENSSSEEPLVAGCSVLLLRLPWSELATLSCRFWPKTKFDVLVLPSGVASGTVPPAKLMLSLDVWRGRNFGTAVSSLFFSSLDSSPQEVEFLSSEDKVDTPTVLLHSTSRVGTLTKGLLPAFSCGARRTTNSQC